MPEKVWISLGRWLKMTREQCEAFIVACDGNYVLDVSDLDPHSELRFTQLADEYERDEAEQREIEGLAPRDYGRWRHGR